MKLARRRPSWLWVFCGIPAPPRTGGAVAAEATPSLTRRSLVAALAALAIVVFAAPQARADDVVVFAAASLKDALDAINADWQKRTGKHATISYAASSALAKQIEADAPADVFISADLDWMSYLDARKLILPTTRRDLLSNTLVLIAPADSKLTKVDLMPGSPLATLLDGGKLAMADPAAVPAGKYGKAALTKLGVWDSVAGSVAAAENVRSCLLLVARGEAPLGIVYRTDAAIEPKVRIVGSFPADTVPTITYPLAQAASSKNADAGTFIAYLSSPAATAVFEKYGFTVLDGR